MPKFIVERKVQGVGHSSQQDLQEMSHRSNEALNSLGGQVMWLESFVTDDATYCIYVAPNEELIKRHAEIAGFPADKITKVDMIIDPSTGDSPQASNMSAKGKGMENQLRQ